jgi:hypothetical protein
MKLFSYKLSNFAEIGSLLKLQYASPKSSPLKK